MSKKTCSLDSLRLDKKRFSSRCDLAKVLNYLISNYLTVISITAHGVLQFYWVSKRTSGITFTVISYIICVEFDTTFINISIYFNRHKTVLCVCVLCGDLWSFCYHN